VKAWFAASRDEVIVPASVAQEAAYFVSTRRGPRAEAAFVRGLLIAPFLIEPLVAADLARAAEVVEAYADFPIGFVDASIVAIAERLEITTLLTTDRRHFGVVRPAHCPRLVLVP
jgi:predicted nucleic acid-binding protein